MGPLIDKGAVDDMLNALEQAEKHGGKILFGGGPALVPGLEGGHYVQPTIVDAEPDLPVMAEETFAPILYVMGYDDMEQAIAIHNQVDQGLSSAIFTDSLRQGGAVPFPRGLGLRHSQREHRHQRR